MNNFAGNFFKSMFLIGMLYALVGVTPAQADGPVKRGISHFELLVEFNQGLLVSDAAIKPYVSWLTLQPGYFFDSKIRLNASLGTVFINPGSALIVGGQVTYRFYEPDIPIAVNFGIEGLIDIDIGNQDFEYLGSIISAYFFTGKGGVSLRWGYEFASEQPLVSVGINIKILKSKSK